MKIFIKYGYLRIESKSNVQIVYSITKYYNLTKLGSYTELISHKDSNINVK